MSRKLGEVRWPRRVQPYVDAMRSTNLVADLHCDRAGLRVHSYARADLLYDTNSWCLASQNTANADQIRTLLHLPPVDG